MPKKLYRLTLEGAKESHNISAVRAEEDTKINTIYGEATIEKGNYIATDVDGNQYGIHAEDFKNNYKEVKATGK